MEATEPSTFAVIFSNDHGSLAFHCENAIGEQLDGMRKDAWEFQGFKDFKIKKHFCSFPSPSKCRGW